MEILGIESQSEKGADHGKRGGGLLSMKLNRR